MQTCCSCCPRQNFRQKSGRLRYVLGLAIPQCCHTWATRPAAAAEVAAIAAADAAPLLHTLNSPAKHAVLWIFFAVGVLGGSQAFRKVMFSTSCLCAWSCKHSWSRDTFFKTCMASASPYSQQLARHLWQLALEGSWQKQPRAGSKGCTTYLQNNPLDFMHRHGQDTCS